MSMMSAGLMMAMLVFLIVVVLGLMVGFRWYAEREFRQNRAEAGTPVRKESRAPGLQP